MCGGVRQGDSLSPMLHMVSVEVLACKIRDSSDIVGFSLPSAQGRQYYRLPRWVIDHLNKLIWSFLWGSKIETVSRHTVFYHARDSGLGLVNFSLKAKALCLASLLRVLDDPSSARFYLARYFCSSRLSCLPPEWAFLRDNRCQNAFFASCFYSECLAVADSLCVPSDFLSFL